MKDIPLIGEFSTNPEALLGDLKQKSELYWRNRGEVYALDLFHHVVERVPAYKRFLMERDIDHTQIITIEDYRTVPTTNKENYLLAYPTEELTWDASFKEGGWIFSSTSGSTGEPYYFPRKPLQDHQFTLTAEIMLRDFFDIENKSTLFIDCFALGVWIGGMFMYQAIRSIIGTQRYPISIITPGADKVESLKAVEKLAGKFDQVILGGYGPLVKDLIDLGRDQGINWDDYNMRYFFAAEGFTEGFRDYIVKNGGVKDPIGTINHYGTADMGTMAHETPLSIFIRQQAVINKDFHKAIFGDEHKLPTLVQYIPELFYFEIEDERLICTSPAGLPLIRYDLKDRGGITSFDQMQQKLKDAGIDAKKELKDIHEFWNLPFIYIFDRQDLTVSIYSVNIYPQSIQRALEHSELQEFITSRFTMLVDYDSEQNQYLEINIELKPNVSESEEIQERVKNAVINILEKENSEWRDFYADPGIKHKVTPQIILWQNRDPKYFGGGGKQKWVKK